MESQDHLFAKVHTSAPEPIDHLLGVRHLQWRDVALMHCMITWMNPRTGRVMMRPSAMAKRLQTQLSTVVQSLKRLKHCHVLVNQIDRDSGAVYYLFCPQYVSVGSEQKAAYLWKQFADAMQEEYDSGELTMPEAS